MLLRDTAPVGLAVGVVVSLPAGLALAEGAADPDTAVLGVPVTLPVAAGALALAGTLPLGVAVALASAVAESEGEPEP